MDGRVVVGEADLKNDVLMSTLCALLRGGNANRKCPTSSGLLRARDAASPVYVLKSEALSSGLADGALSVVTEG